MLREEAIEVLEDLWRYEHSEFSEKDIREALDMAIQALTATSELSKSLKAVNRYEMDEKVLIGFNMAVAIFNKCFGEIGEIGEMSEQMPSYNSIKTELNGDLIPRQAVITMLNKIENAIDDGDGFQFNEWVDYAKDIPSAEKTAEWIIHKDTIGVTNEILYIFECSGCGKCVTEQSRFCPNCGRRMKGVEE